MYTNSIKYQVSTVSWKDGVKGWIFQYISVLFLQSANAEELEERESHRKLEKNYGFVWDESRLTEEEEEN